MDILQDYIPTIFNLYTDYYTPYEPYIRPYIRYVYLAQSFLYSYIFPTLYPIYRLSTILFSRLLSDKPDLISLFILAVVLFISLKVLDVVRRQVQYMISLALNALMWLGIGLLGWYVYQRGVEQSIEDAGYVFGLLAGLGDEGERIGKSKGRQKMRDSKSAGYGNPRGRTRGAGW